MPESITFSAPVLISSLRTETKIIRPRITFTVKTSDIYNQYELYSRTCTYGLSVLEGGDLPVLYAPVVGIRSLHVIIAIASAEDLIFFSLTSPIPSKILVYPILNKEFILAINLLHTYFDAYHAQDIYDRHSVASTAHIFNGTVIDCCVKKTIKTSRISYNFEARTMYTGAYKIRIIIFIDKLLTP